jgi:hypothetical protein
MQEVEEPLFSLIEGEKCELLPAQLGILKRYFERVGLLIDVSTSNRDINDTYKIRPDYLRSNVCRQAPPVFSDDARNRWLNGEELTLISVFIGHHAGILGLNPNIEIAHGVDADLRGWKVPAKRVLMCIGKLTFCITLRWPLQQHDRSLHRLGSDPVPLSWPMDIDVSYDQFFALLCQEPRIVGLRAIFRNPQMRAEIEEYSRLKGEFDIPPSIILGNNRV